MNTKLFALALASITVAAVNANDADCDFLEIGKLTGFASSPNLQPCQDQTGYNFVPPSALPTDEQQAKLCASKECNALIKEVIALDPSDCKILGILNVRELVFGFDDTCAKITGTPAPAPAPAATTSAPAPAATSAAPVMTPAPAAATPEPAATVPANSPC